MKNLVEAQRFMIRTAKKCSLPLGRSNVLGAEVYHTNHLTFEFVIVVAKLILAVLHERPGFWGEIGII